MWAMVLVRSGILISPSLSPHVASAVGRRMDLHGNLLTGPIPSTIGQLMSIQ